MTDEEKLAAADGATRRELKVIRRIMMLLETLPVSARARVIVYVQDWAIHGVFAEKINEPESKS